MRSQQAKFIFSTILSGMLFLNMSCQQQEAPVNVPCNNDVICNQHVLKDPQIYSNGSPDLAFIDSLVVTNSCLTITVGVSGCNFSANIKLIDSGEITGSNPPERKLYLYHVQYGDCSAYFVENHSFFIEPLTVGDETLFTVINSGEGNFGPWHNQKQVLYKACKE